MYNWILTKDTNNNVEYLMIVNGKTAVVHHAPYEKALHIAQRGVVSIGDNPDYPVAVDDVFFFKGEIELWKNNEPAAEPVTEPEVKPEPASDNSKKKSKKKVDK